MITAHVESFEAVLDELKPLLPTHWQELALDKDEVPLDPQYDYYIKSEHLGQLMFITLREVGALAGYFIGFVAPGLHYKTCLTLHCDIWYVWPANRGNGAGAVLLDAVEKEAKRRGVQRMFVGTKLHKDSGWLLQRLGYQEVERTFSKTFFGSR